MNRIANKLVGLGLILILINYIIVNVIEFRSKDKYNNKGNDKKNKVN
ncbi:hypothetical protein [Anaeromicrobium sediminis]|nr:hypothetical protein [Anaeromicrobium sediminis]